MKKIAFLLLGITVVMFFWRYRKGDPASKLVWAFLWFVTVVSFASLAPMFKPIVLLYVLHLVALGLSWVGMMHYLMTGRVIWWFFAAPIATVLLFVGLSFVDGSRYEDMRIHWFHDG